MADDIIFTKGQRVKWSVRGRATLDVRPFGIGPFRVREILTVPAHECSCGRRRSKASHDLGCRRLVELVNHPQWVVLEDIDTGALIECAGGNKFSGAYFKPA
jgi:hypothetical protein